MVKLRGLGPPAPAVFCSMIGGRTGESGVPGSLLAGMSDMPPPHVRLCRLGGCKLQDRIKIAIALGDPAQVLKILEFFRSMGATVTQGSAPSG